MSTEKNTLENLKKILSVSDKIAIRQMRNILEMDEKTFDKKIIDWAVEFGFRIDGDYININRGTINDFIDHLDKQFKAWELQEETGIGKIEVKANYEDLIKKEAEGKTKKIISFRNSQIIQYEANVLQELENQLNKKFTLVDKVDWNTEMGFSVENNQVIGIGFYNCEVSTLPESIGDLKSLKTLNLYGNQLSTLPESIGGLKSLTYLNLKSNQLSTLPESIGNFFSLKELNLNNNQLSTLPEPIGNLKLLETLDLENNKLTTLPKSIGNLSSLEELFLHRNQLTTLPVSICNLSSLENLWINDNQLTTLPESIGNLKSLQRLELYNNKLTTLPESIKILERRGVTIRNWTYKI